MPRLLTWWRPTVLFVTVMALVVALVAAQPRKARADGAPRLSAAEIADAVLFNEGPAARYLTPRGLDPIEWNESTRELQRRIQEAITADARWAARFQQMMQSGDPRAVAVALSELGDMIRHILDVIFDPELVSEWLHRLGEHWLSDRLGLVQVVDHQNSQDVGVDTAYQVNKIVHTNIAVVVDTVAAIQMVILIMLFLIFTEGDEQAQLTKDVIIADIANDLHMYSNPV